MKNTIYTKLLITALLAFSISSCKEDLLDPVPKTSVSDLSAYDTPDRIESLVNGLYRGVKNGNFLGGRYFIYNDIRGEEFLNQTNNGVTGLQTWNFTVNASSNEVNNLWNSAYAAVNNMNLFLDKVDAAPAKITTEKIANYKGEARFLRALTYFSLVNVYAQPFTKDNGASLGLPLRLKGETGAGNSNNLKRSTVAEVYSQILDDLNFAEANLPANYSTQDLNVTRAHKNSAIALKVKVYLAMGKYNDVVNEASKIVPAAAPYKAANGVRHELNANFASIFTSYRTLESILSMPMATNDVPGTQNQLAFYYLAGPVGGGEFSLNPTGIYGSKSFEDTDDRKKLTSVSGTRIYLTKFPGGSPYIDWVPVMRYAEVLLSYAEARARLTVGVDASAVAMLNAVRSRSKGSVLAPTTKEELISAILTERRIEFLGEGLRAFDISRLNAPFPAKGPVNAVNPSQSEYIWPIPTTELAVNKDCVPNP
ncbi:RagB/SusD domain-containing protein [Emticicia oligotrophica DSM 17448]|uniref:RagB/SusD domain-containing protein n=1 Tax=Emticicia oligotrophica (strain DSM 17448 / CIP 109782 / MTCC 6937 / GPTSA100-15) TaxID=929562 RepID=A0ABN4APB7_EMTOG|nr:RagB/SusD family nutrient uptake outer membrane protein [Emticicia oligotrophica]AFK04193.1 RagB/SusD domain-containing protein [Emticicia oligotrophica DSM 17448]